MQPLLIANDIPLFYKYLDKATHYFEFGSGGSTYQAAQRTGIQSITSVESDLEWHNKLKRAITDTSRINFIYNSMDTRPNNWGRPGPKSTKADWINYSNHIMKDLDLAKKLDFMLIDGRFRVACCLKSFDVISDTCLIAFDDFLNRKEYHVVLDYYDIIDKSVDNQMVILKKKSGCSPSKELIGKYEIIMD